MLPTHSKGTAHARFSSEVKASWTTITLFVVVQYLCTLCTSLLGGPSPYEATNTDLLYDPSITLFLGIFLTFKINSISGILLAIYNAALLTALLGWPQAWNMKISRKQALTHGFSILGVIGLRMLLGYLFGRGTGYAYPSLFFNDAIHETTCGFSVIIIYCIMCRAYQNTNDNNDHGGLFKFLPISLLLWAPNALRGPVFFWSFSTACVSGIQGLLSLLLEGRQPYWAGLRRRSSNSQQPPRLKRFFSMLRTFFLLSTVFAVISLVHSLAYHYKHNVHTQQAKNLPEPVLTDFLLLSYPRRDDSTLLSSALQSYAPSLGSRFNVRVYTTVAPGSHAAFSDAQRSFIGSPGISFFRDPNPTPPILSRPIVPGFLPAKQTLDLYSALSWAENNVHVNATRYLGIMEDDFEWCKDGWDELKALLYEVSIRELSKPSEDRFCGIFIATGGSGLLVRPSIVPLLREALQKYAFELNPDIILQDCLRGALPLCAECKLSASRRLLLRHTGASQSTYHGRTYPEDRWQCGWRQPFNGKLGVWVP